MVDVDDGNGNALNVFKTIRMLEAAGAIGVMMEDQRGPLRTPNVGGVAVISVDAAIGKIKAAVDVRRDQDFFILARTESCWCEGLDAAIERANHTPKQAPTAFF